MLRIDRRGVFHFAALQSAAGSQQLVRHGHHAGGLDTIVVIANYQRPASASFAKGGAALFVLTALGWPWKAAALLRVLPVAALDAAYGAIARNRYRPFGKREHCFVPGPQHRSRFAEPSDVIPNQEEVWQGARARE